MSKQWDKSPGQMAQSANVDWDIKTSMWGPENPLIPAKTWGPINIVYAAIFIIIVSAIPSLIAITVIFADQSADSQTIESNLESLTTNGPFLVVSLALLWLVFAGYPGWVTRFRGSKNFASDFKLTVHWKTDIAFGVAIAAALRLAELGAVSFMTAIGTDLTNAENSSFLTDPYRAIVWTILLAVGAGLGAPIFEEIFFRGFVLQAMLRNKKWVGKKIGKVQIPTILAVLVSSAFFGVLHTTALDAGGIFLAVFTGLLGMSFAIIVLRYNRLGPAISAHAVFNISGVISVLWASYANSTITILMILGVLSAVYLQAGNKMRRTETF